MSWSESHPGGVREKEKGKTFVVTYPNFLMGVTGKVKYGILGDAPPIVKMAEFFLSYESVPLLNVFLLPFQITRSRLARLILLPGPIGLHVVRAVVSRVIVVEAVEPF